jgi:hypothetical protein
MLSTRDTAQVLDRDFLESRAKILELAAILDRIDRATDHAHSAGDARLGKLREAIEALAETGSDRAETIQRLFSLEYDPAWLERMEIRPKGSIDR